MIKILIEAGYDFQNDKGCIDYYENEEIQRKDSLAYIAAQNGDVNVIEALIAARYDFVNDEGCVVYDENGDIESKCSLAYIAAQNGHMDAIKALGDAG